MDETNGTTSVAENTKEPVNPYLADAPSQSQDIPTPPKSPIPEGSQKGTSSNKAVIGVVMGVLALLLIFVIVLVVAFPKMFQDDKRVITDAMRATMTESSAYIKEVWELEQYTGMFEDGIYTMDAQLDFADGTGIDMVIQKNEEIYGVYVSLLLGRMSLLDAQLYADDAEIVIALPEMVDYIFTINKDTLEEDIQNMVDIGMIDQESADQIIALNKGGTENQISQEMAEKFQKDIISIIVAFFNDCEVKKGDTKTLQVNEKRVKCQGYDLIFTGENLADLATNLKNVYEENAEYFDAVNEIFSSYGTDIVYDTEELCDELERQAESYREDAEETDVIEFYLYDGKIAQIYADDDSMSFTWNIEGGNFPLENTSIIVEDEDEKILEIKRTGSDNGEYLAKYEIEEYGDSYAVDIRRRKRQNEFSIEIFAYDYSFFYIDGSFEKVDDATIEISIDSMEVLEEEILSGDIEIENSCGTIKRPEGEEKEVFLLTEDEWDDILWDIAMSLY